MTVNRANAVVLSAAADLLATLLATPLPRGMRCATCAAYQADDERSGSCGWAAELRRYSDGVMVADGCVYWEPADRCGLDRGGVQRDSPASEEFMR